MAQTDERELLETRELGEDAGSGELPTIEVGLCFRLHGARLSV